MASENSGRLELLTGIPTTQITQAHTKKKLNFRLLSLSLLGDPVFYSHIMYYFYRAYSAEHNSQSFMEPGLDVQLYFSLSIVFLCVAQTVHNV